MLRRTQMLLLVVVLVGMLQGCKQQPAEPVAETPAAHTPKIAGIVFQEDQFFRLVLFGMRDAARRMGAELFEGNSANRPDREIQLVNTYISRGVDAIIISPLSAKASVAALKRARDAGIKVITYNSTTEGDMASSFIESEQSDLGAQSGKAAVKFIQEQLGGKAKVAILAFKSQVPEQSDARSGGFKRELSSLPGVEVVAEQDAWLAEMAIKRVGDILTAHPDVNVIWAANEGGTVGAVMAVKNAGKAGQIAVFGTDISEQLISFLSADDPVLQAVTGQRPYDIGTRAVEAALNVIQNRPVEKKVTMAGVMLTRENPQGIVAYQTQLRELTSAGVK